MTNTAEDFRLAREQATAHVQLQLAENGVVPEERRIEATVFRVFKDETGTLKLDQVIFVALPGLDEIDEWAPLNLPDVKTWERARVVEVYLRRQGEDWHIVKGQLTLLRAGTATPANPAQAGGFGVTEGPGLRPSASVVASPEESKAAIAQANREAAAAAKPLAMRRANEHLRTTWMANSRAQRIAMIAALILAPIMIILFLTFGGDTPTHETRGGLQTSRDDMARIMRGANVMDVPSGLSNGSVPGLNTKGTAAEREDWYYIKFLIDPNVEGIGFNDFAGITHGAVVCDEDDAAAKTGKARMWMRIADAKSSEIHDEGDHFIVGDRTFAKKLSLDLDGHVFTPTSYSVMTTTDGRTLLTGLFDPDETFHAAFKNATHMELASGERTLAMNTSGNEEKLTHVASQCAALGTPF